MSSAPKPSLLERLALHRPELRAWALYDWANSAMITVVVTAVWPLYFKDVAAGELDPNDSTNLHTLATTIGLVLVALVAPVLGALADYRAIKKRLLGLFAGIGISATACMVLVEEGDWLLGMILFVLANFGAAGSFVFYDALLPHVARDDEVDRVSVAGYALGYVGGGAVLLLALFAIRSPATFGLPEEGTLAVRLSFLLVAVWWAIFSLPLFRRVAEPPRRLEADETGTDRPVRTAIIRLRETFGELKSYREAFVMLAAFLVYNDGIVTIYRMATSIGNDKGFSSETMIAAIALVQFVGIPCAFGYGLLAQRFGTKRMVLLGLGAYALIAMFSYWMETERQFIVLAISVGVVQGGCQALSRSMFASLVPKHKSGEFFALFAVGEKFAGIFGPLVFGLFSVVTGSSSSAVLAIVGFFAVGAWLLSRVDLDAGQARARAVDAETRLADQSA